MPPRRTLLVAAAVLLVAGLTAGLVVAFTSGGGKRTLPPPTTTAPPVPHGKLRVKLTADTSGVVAGELALLSQVDGPNGPLGTTDCLMLWREFVHGKLVHTNQTECGVTLMVYQLKPAGIHRFTATATSLAAGDTSSGTGAVAVLLPG